ncbi:MAG: ribbon-helix-helix protein, CopG family [Desulfuromonadales bacterium]|nr:ribbon-helix-helix protein, CopG family [Desulfuromonadales bacterium]
MPALSLRLPEELEHRLKEEAHREGVPRSEVARQAISDYLARREHEHFINELVAEARAGYGIAAVRDEALALVEDALDSDHEIAAERWWR